MSAEATNVAILQDAYRLWGETKGGSVDHWMAICDDNIRFGSLGQGAGPAVASYMCNYCSRDQLGQYFDGLARDWEMIEYRADRFVAQGDSVIVLGHCSWKYRRTGKVVSTPKADSWRFANGKAIEYFEFFDTAQVHGAVS